MQTSSRKESIALGSGGRNSRSTDRQTGTRGRDTRGLRLVAVVSALTALATSQVPAQELGLQNLKIAVYQDALKSAAEPVLNSCGSWPPRFVDKKDVNNPKAKLAKEDASQELLAALAADAGLEPGTGARQYDGFFLRLFDSVTTFNAGTADTNLLGFLSGANTGDAVSGLWGTSLFTAKYDCLSLLNASAGVSGNYALPFFYVGGAFNASRDVKSAKQAILIYGRFESPFSRSYFGNNAAAQTYAAFKALAWRELHGKDLAATYVRTARLLSIQTTSADSSATSLSGSLKAGVSIPLFSANAAAAGALASELTAGGKTFVTYFDGAAGDLLAPLPGFDDLMKTVRSNVGAQHYLLDRTEFVKSKSVAAASVTIDGWPSEVCNGKWVAGANPAYTADADLKPSGQKCAIAFRLSLSGPNVGNATPDDIANPGLYLQYKDDNQIKINFEPQEKPHLLGETHMDLDTNGSSWSKSPAASEPANVDYLEWSFGGTVVTPDKRKQVTSASLNAGNFTCKDAAGRSLPFTAVGFPQTGSSDLKGTVQVAGTNNLKLAARLDPKQLPRHDSDANQDNKVNCTISGIVTVTITDSTTAVAFDQDLAVTAKHQIEFPSEILDVLVAPSLTVSTPAVGQVIVSWKRVDGAKYYNVFRSDILGNQDYTTPLNKAVITTAAYSDSTGTPGTTYYYTVRAYNALAKAGTPSAEAPAIPKAAPRQPSSPTVQYTFNKDKTAVTLTWNAIDGAVYDVHRVDFRNHQLDTTIQTRIAGTTATDSISDPDAVLAYYVVAFVGSLASPPSAQQMVIPKAE